MSYLETREEMLGRVSYLKVLKGVLTLSGKSASEKRVIRTEKGRISSEVAYLTKEKAWNFNFEGGGWNCVYAKTKDVAISRAKRKYGSGSPVDERTFRVATEEDTKLLLSLFN